MAGEYPRPYFNRYAYPGVDPDIPGAIEVTCVAFASLDDDDTFTIVGPNGVKIFEFDTANNGVAGGNVDVGLTGGETADQVRDKLVTAINSAPAAIGVQAVATTAGKLVVTPAVPGTLSASENVTNAGFTLAVLTANSVGDQVQPAILGEVPCAFRATGIVDER